MTNKLYEKCYFNKQHVKKKTLLIMILVIVIQLIDYLVVPALKTFNF